MTSRSRFFAAGLCLAVVLIATGCSRFGFGFGSTGTPLTTDDAVGLVLAQDPAFAGIGPRDPRLIGQAAWYEVADLADGWRVTVRIGWGDCPSGCINEHRWIYDVTQSGEVRLVSETGPSIPAGSGVSGTATAGPICPVERDPPDPACADRPVDGALLVIEDFDGHEISRVTTDPTGRFAISLSPGAYRLVPQPVPGLLGTPGPIEFRVEAGEPPLELVVAYDTGIR